MAEASVPAGAAATPVEFEVAVRQVAELFDMGADDARNMLRAFHMRQLERVKAEGYAGVLGDGRVVDRRRHPEAIAMQQNPAMGIPEPKPVGEGAGGTKVVDGAPLVAFTGYGTEVNIDALCEAAGPLLDLVERAVRNVDMEDGLPRWSAVGACFGCGSGTATKICRAFGLDPNEANPQEEECEDADL